MLLLKFSTNQESNSRDIVVVFVIIMVADNIDVVVVVDPRNLHLKFGQNQVSFIEFWSWMVVVYSHFHINLLLGQVELEL